jgi:hypothetical protein
MTADSPRLAPRPFQLSRWLLVASALLGTVAAQAAPPQVEGEWQFKLTPYLWLPNVNSTLRYALPPGQGGSAEAQTGPYDYLENLQFLLMLSGEARRGDWGVISDIVYLDFGNTSSHVTSVGGSGSAVPIPRERNTSTGTDLKGWTGLLAGSYRAWRNDAAEVELLAGLRLLHLEARLDWSLAAATPGGGFVFDRAGSVEASETLTAGIVGVRGRMTFGDGRWFAPYHLDVGGGNEFFTWQVVAGVGYAFPWGEVQLSWRNLAFEQPDDHFIQKLRFSGPAVGASWRF